MKSISNAFPMHVVHFDIGLEWINVRGIGYFPLYNYLSSKAWQHALDFRTLSQDKPCPTNTVVIKLVLLPFIFRKSKCINIHTVTINMC